jgi:hypothetical protein
MTRTTSVGDVARCQRRQASYRRVPLDHMPDVGRYRGTRLIWVVHTVRDEPKCIVGVDDLSGRFAAVENRPLNNRAQLAREGRVGKRERQTFPHLGHATMLFRRTNRAVMPDVRLARRLGIGALTGC